MRAHSYPSWFYGPNGQAEVFESEDAVPADWHDHPSKVITPEKTGSKPLPPTTDKVPGEQTGTKPIVAKNNATAEQSGGAGTDVGDVSNTVDAGGHPWDAAMHSATQTKTKDNLWRMKVGVARPAPREGFPKAPLDL